LYNQKFFTGSRDTTIRKYDVNTGKCLLVMEGHTNSVRTIDVWNDILISGGKDNSIRTWNANNGETILIQEVHNDFINTIKIRKDDTIDKKLVFSGSRDKLICIYTIIFNITDTFYNLFLI
jgi:WD40 repeat protein